VASWLNAIEILPSGDMIVVGNDSTTLHSTDGGATWNNMLIPDSVNFPVHLNSVDFLNGDFGVIVGNNGQILFYEAEVPSVPTVIVNTAIIASVDSVWMSGNVWANGSDTDIYFDYGPTPSLGFTIDANPSMLAASDSAYAEALLTDIAFGIYYYQLRAVNQAGVSLSSIQQLYIGDFYSGLNLDFEYWDEDTVILLNEWRSQGNISQSAPYSGAYSVRIDGGGTQDSFGAIIYGNVDNDFYHGGLPVSATPDSIVGYFNYFIEPGTEGLILVVLKKDGQPIHEEFILYNGSSNGLFERLAFPISYTGIEVPDSVVLGLANNNPFTGSVSSTNFVIVDNLAFTPNGLGAIPNGQFEDWEAVEVARPIGWYSEDFEGDFGVNRTVFQTTDSQHGQYAMILANDLENDDRGEIRTDTVGYYQSPSFPVAGRHAALNGYYKYDMQGINDTLNITVAIFQNGSTVGGSEFIVTSTVVNYTPFQMALTYIDGTVIPDSASISIRIGNDFQLGASVLTIDNLSFDGVTQTSLITAVEKVPTAPHSFIVYPNPTDGVVWIESDSDLPITNVMAYSLQGALVYQRSFNANQVQIDMKDQPAGIYFLHLFSGDGTHVQTKKLIRY
jgi:hypothetical protein